MTKKTEKSFMQNNLAKVRGESDLSQRAFADLVDAHHSAVNRIEQSKQGMSVDELFLFARVLGVHPDKIVDMSEFKGKADLDQTVLGLVIGWMHEAIEKAGIDVPPKKIGEWTSFAYKEIIEQDLAFSDMRKYVYDLVKLQSPSQTRK